MLVEVTTTPVLVEAMRDADASGRESCVDATSGGHVLERTLIGNGAGVGSGAGDRPGERAHA